MRAAKNPHEIIECNNRNDNKVMIFVAIAEGRVAIVHPFLDEEGRRVSVDGASCYLKLLQDHVWPTFRSTTTRHNLCVDARRCSTTLHTDLLAKFHGRVVNRGTPIPWPAHSPDLNPLDFHFWAAAQEMVYKKKPQSIELLVQCIKQFASSYDPATLRRVSQNVLKRARLCLQAGGGHFQHIL